MLHVTPASAVACVPAHGPESHPDAELLDLWRRREIASAAADAAGKRVDAIDDATVYPDPPAALFVREGDDALKLATYAEERDDGRLWYPFKSANDERRGWRRDHWRWQERPVTPEDWPNGEHETISRRVPWPEAQARADEIAAAWDDWSARKAEIYASSGYDAANTEWEALDDALAAIDGAIMATPARTLDDVRIKARLAHLELDRGEELWAALATSLVRDLVALPAASVPAHAPDPVLVAVSESCATLLEHIDACESPAAETPEGDARRSAAGKAAFAAWKVLLATTPTTIAGIQALSWHVPWYLDRGGAFDAEDHKTLFRQIAGADLLDCRGAAEPPAISPRKSSGLSAAVDDLDRLDRELRVLCLSAGMRDQEEVPGYLDREAERDAVLKTLIETVAIDGSDLKAKGRALRTSGLIGDPERHGDLAISLAEDLERLTTPISVGMRKLEAPAPLLMAAE